MQSLSRLLCGGGFGIWIALVGCKDHPDDAKATREDCQKVSEHIADIIVDTAKKDPALFWDMLHQQPGEAGIPATVTRDSFPQWLASPEGDTWMMKRRGQTLAGTQQAVDECIKNARKKDVTCFLAAKTGDDIGACDRARQPAQGNGSGSATGSATETAPGSAAGSGSGTTGSGSAM